jgi:hypothetical protein
VTWKSTLEKTLASQDVQDQKDAPPTIEKKVDFEALSAQLLYLLKGLMD